MSVLLFLHESRPQAQSGPRQPWACTERRAPCPSARRLLQWPRRRPGARWPQSCLPTPRQPWLPGGCPWHPPGQQIEKLSSPPLLRLSTRLGPGVLESGKVFHCQGLVSAGPWLARCRQAVDGVPALTPGQPDCCLSVPCGHCLLRTRSRPLTRACVCVCPGELMHPPSLRSRLRQAQRGWQNKQDSGSQHGLQTPASRKALPPEPAPTTERTTSAAPGHSTGSPLKGSPQIRTLEDPTGSKPKSACTL